MPCFVYPQFFSNEFLDARTQQLFRHDVDVV
jgi:hypothetical protein